MGYGDLSEYYVCHILTKLAIKSMNFLRREYEDLNHL